MKAFLLFIISFFAVQPFASAAEPKPTFHYVAPGWTSAQSIEMDPFWAAAGLPERGMNYYLVGGPSKTSPFWDRFDPSKPTYQAWFGAYVVDGFEFANEWMHPNLQPKDIPRSVQRVLTLASVDQLVWLTAYGDPLPKAEVDQKSVVVVPIGNNFFAIYCQIRSHSDVGAPALPYPWYPPPSSDVDAFAPVILHSTAVFKYSHELHRLVVVYASGTEWTMKDGTKRRTPATIYLQQALMMSQVSLQ